MRHIILVVGPPCAGKTTWVKRHAGPNDLIIDWDVLAQEAGSPVEHDHHPEHAALATRQRRHLEHHASRMRDGTAYVIRTGIHPKDVRSIAGALNATMVKTIDPGYDTVMTRAIQANRSTEIRQVIKDWYGNRKHY